MARSRDGRHLNVVLDKELYALLKAYADRNGYTVSTIARDALRKYFAATSDPVDAGWREGYLAANRTVLETVKRAMASIPGTPPSRGVAAVPEDALATDE